MAFTANTTFYQVLEDNANYAVLKFGAFNTAAGNTESDVLKVNTANLTCRTVGLVTSNATLTGKGVGFTPGEQITGNTSGAIGYVTHWEPAANTLYVVYAPGSAAFSATENVDSSMLKTRIQLASITTPVYKVSVRSIWWNVAGTGMVELEWLGNSIYNPIITLTGSGYFGENALPTLIPNNAADPVTVGNIYASTFGLPASGSYTVVLELAKLNGYAQRPVY